MHASCVTRAFADYTSLLLQVDLVMLGSPTSLWQCTRCSIFFVIFLALLSLGRSVFAALSYEDFNYYVMAASSNGGWLFDAGLYCSGSVIAPFLCEPLMS